MIDPNDEPLPDNPATYDRPSPISTTNGSLPPTTGYVPSDPSIPLVPSIPGYEIGSVLGKGGMGVVFQARNVALNRQVALKTLLAGRLEDERQLTRFLYEAEALAAVRHINVVQVYESGECGGQPYLVLELLAGGSLAGRWRKDRGSSREVAGIMLKVARGVAAAHALGIVHRDLKPGNVLFDENGEPKVTDFGIAKRGGSDLTATEATVGTPSYMSPEQARGQTRLAGTPADVWALGVMLYEGLTGRLPFEADHAVAVLKRIIEETPTSPHALDPAVPRDLDVICLKCLFKEPDRRYATAAELADDLERFLTHQPIRARPASLFDIGRKWVRRNPSKSFIATFLSLAIVLVLFASLQYRRNLAVAKQEQAWNLLIEAKPSEALRLADQLDLNRFRDRLRGAIANHSQEPVAALNAALALGGSDDLAVEHLTRRAAAAGPEELELIRSAFRDGPFPIDVWWASALGTGEPSERLAAAALLARADPRSNRWQEIRYFLIDELAGLPESTQGGWVNLFRDVSPQLHTALSERLRATEQPQALDRYRGVMSLLREEALQNLTRPWPLNEHLNYAAQKLHQALGRIENEGERSASVVARALALGLREGRDAPVWTALRHDDDPRIRTHLIYELSRVGVSVRTFMDRYGQESDVGVRQALLLVIGDYEGGGESSLRKAFLDQLEAAYRTDPDPGVHSAIGLLARRWGQSVRFERLDRELIAEPDGRRNWYVTPHGKTMAIVRGPIDFRCGSSLNSFFRTADGSEREARVVIPRDLAVATMETTASEFSEMLADLNRKPPPICLLAGSSSFAHMQTHLQTKQHSVFVDGAFGRYHSHPNSAMGEVHQREAMMFCRWLSEKHGLPENQMCYPPVWEIAYGASPYPDYLERTGYRLPTDREWEFAARAGSRLNYHFGANVVKGDHYGWSQATSNDAAHLVGRLKPNALGLFDVHGNVFERCHGFRLDQGAVTTPEYYVDRPKGSWASEEFTLRGGSFARDWRDAQLGFRFGFGYPQFAPDLMTGDMGMRVCRTLGRPPVVPLEMPDQWRERITLRLTGTGRFSVREVSDPGVIVSPASGSLPAEVQVIGLLPLRQDGFHARIGLDGTDEELHLWRDPDETAVRIVPTRTVRPGLRMVLVPAGTYQQGTDPTILNRVFVKLDFVAQKRVAAESQPRQVTFSRPFSLSETEVEISQFLDFVESTKYLTVAEQRKGARCWNGVARAMVDGPMQWRFTHYSFVNSFPVSCIDYADAAAYCRWLSQQTKEPIRLPSEAEWEYAARAGSTTLWPCGDRPELLPRYAHYKALKPAPVRQLRPNAFGLYGMLGNVAEVLEDKQLYEKWAPSAVTDPRPVVSDSTKLHVNRGGAFDVNDPLFHARPGWRDESNPDITANTNGFRIAAAGWQPRLRAEVLKHERGRIYQVSGSASAFRVNVHDADSQVVVEDDKVPGSFTVYSPANSTTVSNLTVASADGLHAVAVTCLNHRPTWRIRFFVPESSSKSVHDPNEAARAMADPHVWEGQHTGDLQWVWRENAMPYLLRARETIITATTKFRLPAGQYQCFFAAGSGLRLFVNGEIKVNTWPLGREEGGVADFDLPDGEHEFRVEAYDLHAAVPLWVRLRFRTPQSPR